MGTMMRTPRLIFILGALLYLLCLWRACPQVDDKGYFLSVLVLGIFAILAHQQTSCSRFATLCRLVLLLASGLMLLGVWHMPLAPTYKAFVAATWFICMYGASASRSASITQTS